jgi:glycosyltransferase involved in cell wall biosynthesis
MLPLSRRALALAWERGVPFWPGGDSVHAPTPLAPTTVKRGRSLVVTVHDTVPWTHPETLTRHGAAWHRKVISRLTHRADAIVVPTAAVAADLAEHSPGSARVQVIGHGVPDSIAVLPADADAIAARLDLPPRYVLAVGTLEPRKGIDVLIEAMGLPDAPDLPLLIVGPPGWGDVDVQRLAGEHHRSPEQVRSLGWVTDEELAAVLHRAAVFAAPSLAEGFGLPLLEAMAAGVPTVHSDAPALVEVAGGTGVIAPRGNAVALADALNEVLDDPQRAAANVAAARTRAAGFTWRHAAESVWRLHLELHNG